MNTKKDNPEAEVRSLLIPSKVSTGPEPRGYLHWVF